VTDRERAFLLATAAVIVCGTAAGALIGGPSGDGVRTVTRPGTEAQPQSAPQTATDPGGIAITPPAAVDAPDTLKELYDADRVEYNPDADFEIVTIAKKTYEGMSTEVDREGIAGAPRIVINTNGRYKRIEGVVGIRDDAECTENAGSVSITNGSGDRLRVRRASGLIRRRGSTSRSETAPASRSTSSASHQMTIPVTGKLMSPGPMWSS